MKILVLNDDYPPKGQSSVAHVAKDLADAYRRKGHDVRVITTHRRETSGKIIRDGDVVSLPVSYRKSLRNFLMIRMRPVSRMLEREIAAFAPDAVHAHNLHAWLTFDALRVARKHCAKVCITLHDVVSFAYARLATRRYLDSGGKDAALTVADHVRQARLEYNPLRNILIRGKLRHATHIVSPSEALKRALESNGIRATDVIPHGIDTDVWRPQPTDIRAELGLERKRIILFGGRLSTDKGTTAVLNALRVVIRAVPDAILLVIGDPKKWERLVADAKAADCVPYVRLLGWKDRNTLPTVFAAADVVTTPSLCLDVFVLMNIEAMAAGKPVVGTIFGGTPEIVRDGETGYVVDPRDTEAYAGHLITLLKDPALAKKMGDAGRARVEKDYTLGLQADRYLELFEAA